MNKFKKRSTILALGLSVASFSYAQTDSNLKEIEQLRAEVNELRSLLQQQTQQQQQYTVQLKQLQTENLKTVTKSQSQILAQSSNALARTLGGSELKFYGNVRLDAQYQAEGGAAARLYNQISSVPLKGNAERSDEFKSTLSATRLGLEFKSPINDQELSGKIEVDFLGGSNFDNLRIRHAYMNYAQWLIGQTWSNFAVPDYMPETIDALAYVGASVKRTPQVRYSHTFNSNTSIVTAVEDPKDSSINMRLPALTSRLNHKFSDTLAFGARVMTHEKRLDDAEKWAWGVGLGAKYDLSAETSIKADYYHVKGDSSFVSWANSGVVKTASGSIEQNEFDSISFGITQKLNQKLRATLGYGLMKFDEDQDYINALSHKSASNKELWQAWANIFYTPVKPISFGLEYVYGEREAFAAAANGHKTGEDNRVNAVAIYSF